MIDFDPRDHDSRPDERPDIERGRGGRSAFNGYDRDDDLRQRDGQVRDHDDHLGSPGAVPVGRTILAGSRGLLDPALS
jgi:hypothetical protein